MIFGYIVYYVRCILFFFVVFILSGFTCIFGIVEYLLFGKHRIIFFCTKIILFLLRLFCGIRYEINGKLPSNDQYIIAAKHQSILEVIIFIVVFRTVNFIVKQEFLKIPILSTYWKMIGITFVDRNNSRKSIKIVKDMINKNNKLSNETLIIFPEGTRKYINEKPDYKQGVYLLYSIIKKPIVPIALNTGVYWTNNNKLKPGLVNISILQPIEVGLSKTDFMKRLQNTIEIETNKLVTAATSHKYDN